MCALPDDYQVLLLQGGASQQFAMLPMNLLPQDKSADYVVTGVFAKKAYAEAQLVGKVRLAANTEESGGVFKRIPLQRELALDPDAAYVHICSNNTIVGTQYQAYPDTGTVPLIVDMSSDILSRNVDYSRLGVVYAGVQKNIGISGLALVIARKSLIEAGREDIPKIFRYKEHARENSLFNTSPTFAIYMLRNVLSVLKEQGGPSAAEERNRKKAAFVYELIDQNPDFFRSHVERESRSSMNPVFKLRTPELDAKFIAEAKDAGFFGLKGHKLVGGIRASIYNAITESDVGRFVEWARTFSRRNA
jgi:phosphoserine aminotransferase